MSKSYYYKEGCKPIGPSTKITLPFTFPYMILLFLKVNNQKKSYVQEIIKYLESNSSQVSQVLHKLENEKLIDKLKEGRRTVVSITEKGRNFINQYLNTITIRIKDFYLITGLKNNFNEIGIETNNHSANIYKILEKLLQNKDFKNSIEIFSKLNLNIEKAEEVFKDSLQSNPDENIHQYEVKIEKLNKTLDKYKHQNKELKDALRDLLTNRNNLILAKTNLKIKGFQVQKFYNKFLYVSNGLKPEIEWCDDNLKNIHLYQKTIEQLERQGRLTNLFYKSKEWGIRSGEILERDKHSCESCGKKTNRVHHRSSALYNTEICLDPVNLTSMCSRCEDQIHNR